MGKKSTYTEMKLREKISGQQQEYGKAGKEGYAEGWPEDREKNKKSKVWMFGLQEHLQFVPDHAKKKSKWPPSNTGIGSRFSTPRLMLKMAKNKR